MLRAFDRLYYSTARSSPRRRRGEDLSNRSAVIAEMAAKCVRLLHQRLARHHFKHFPVVLLAFHLARLLAADDDDRTDQLMIFRAEMHVADHRREGFALLVGLDDGRRI